MSRRRWLCALVVAATLLVGATARAKTPHVQVQHDARGWKLVADGRDLFVYGMNWGYQPVGTQLQLQPVGAA